MIWVSHRELIRILQQKLKEQTDANAELRRIIGNLQQTNDEMHQTIENLQQTIDGLNQTIKKLTETLGKNSRNSSKPPSTDGFGKPSPKSLREQSGRKPSGQGGHPGSTLKVEAEPDEVILHMPSACSGCPHFDVCKNNGCVGETRQVIDVVVEVKVTAHQSIVINDCPLHGGMRKAEFPDDVNAPVKYGENLQALVVALNTVGAVSVNRTHEILSSVFNIPLSTGTVSNMVSRCADGLTETVDQIGEKVAASPIGNFDETGTRVNGKTNWVHNASNAWCTHLTISGKRGKEGMDEGGVLPVFQGISVHDCWSPYWTYAHIILHALCNGPSIEGAYRNTGKPPRPRMGIRFQKTAP